MYIKHSQNTLSVAGAITLLEAYCTALYLLSIHSADFFLSFYDMPVSGSGVQNMQNY